VQRRLTRATDELHDARTQIARQETAVAARARWDQQHAWRLQRIAEIDDALAHHWADAVLRAARADDPLAFGIRRLRDARATHQHDLETLRRSLPADRRRALAYAEADLARSQQRVHDLEARVTAARAAVDQARRRRSGRRDHVAVAHTTADLHAATTTLAVARDTCAAAARRVNDERHAVDARNEALHRIATPRARLAAAVRDLDLALDLTRPDRVAYAATDRLTSSGAPSARRQPPAADSPPGAASPNNSKPATTAPPPRTLPVARCDRAVGTLRCATPRRRSSKWRAATTRH
jgi:hypothetical protein